jgi:nicotinamidase/pyrazinamidase
MAQALIVVDFQNDFIPGGALAVEHSDEIAGRLNQLAASDRYDLVVATRDWHPPDHGSFTDNGGTWPVHCVQDTEGAQLNSALDRSNLDVVIDKGSDPSSDGYSGFQDTGLEHLLRERGIDKVGVVGLATDYCVKNTALDALRKGFGVEIDEDAMRAVNVEAGDDERAIEEMRAAGARQIPI